MDSHELFMYKYLVSCWYINRFEQFKIRSSSWKIFESDSDFWQLHIAKETILIGIHVDDLYFWRESGA